MKRIFAIGDLHGHFDLWLDLYAKLLDEAKLDPKKDKLVFIGDYVDGGNQVKPLLDWLMKAKKKYPHWEMLYGNHEDLMLDALVYKGRIYKSYDLWWTQGGRETFQSFVPDSLTAYEKSISQVKDHITVKYLDWLRNRPLWYGTLKYFFVHAGLRPGMSINDHIEKIELNDENVKRDMLWIRDEFIDSSYDWGRKIIYGHTVNFDPPFIAKNKIGIDGMYHNQGKLLALELPKEKIYFVSSKG